MRCCGVNIGADRSADPSGSRTTPIPCQVRRQDERRTAAGTPPSPSAETWPAPPSAPPSWLPLLTQVPLNHGWHREHRIFISPAADRLSKRPLDSHQTRSHSSSSLRQGCWQWVILERDLWSALGWKRGSGVLPDTAPRLRLWLSQQCRHLASRRPKLALDRKSSLCRR